jgi:hypothetical protein
VGMLVMLGHVKLSDRWKLQTKRKKINFFSGISNQLSIFESH